LTEKENASQALVVKYEIPQDFSNSKKRAVKQTEKASTRSNQKRAEMELDITVATAATLVSANAKHSQKLAVKEAQERHDELNDRSQRRASSRRLK
jgi:hypothetical protein